MPKRITPLSDVKVRTAKPHETEYKIFDGGGLFLLVTPSGGKLWHFKYRFVNKERKLTFGPYPEISLADAGQRRDEARKQLAHGIDPRAVRKAQKITGKIQAENSFEVVAREWHSRQSSAWMPSHAGKIIRSLELNVFPWLGSRPINEIKAPELLMILRRIESRGALDTAHRMRFVCGQVFRYAIATGRAERDPAADLRGALSPVKGRHLAAVTDPVKVGELLRAIEGYQGSFVTQCLAPCSSRLCPSWGSTASRMGGN